jgi:hypothetical protein
MRPRDTTDALDSAGTPPRPPWGLHAAILFCTLALFFALVVCTDKYLLNQIVLFFVYFLPLAIPYAVVSTWMVWRGARARPPRSAWRVVLPAHGLALPAGVAGIFLLLRFF